MTTDAYEVQVFDKGAGTERWMVVQAETMRHAQACASEAGFIVGDVRAMRVGPSSLYADAAQGVKGVTWSVLAVLVFVVVLAGALAIGNLVVTDTRSSKQRPSEASWEHLPMDADGNPK